MAMRLSCSMPLFNRGGITMADGVHPDGLLASFLTETICPSFCFSDESAAPLGWFWSI